MVATGLLLGILAGVWIFSGVGAGMIQAAEAGNEAREERTGKGGTRKEGTGDRAAFFYGPAGHGKRDKPGRIGGK